MNTKYNDYLNNTVDWDKFGNTISRRDFYEKNHLDLPDESVFSDAYLLGLNESKNLIQEIKKELVKPCYNLELNNDNTLKYYLKQILQSYGNKL